MAKLKITQTRSLIRVLPAQKRTMKALGLHGIRTTVVKENNPALQGMITVVAHLVAVEEAK